MAIEINSMNELAYGNLPQHYQVYLQEENEYTALAESFYKFPFPEIEETYEEINQLINILKKESAKPDFDKTMKIALMVDSHYNTLFKKECEKLKVLFPEENIQNFQDKLASLIVQIKVYYQRPRPFQVAFYTNQDLHPFDSVSAASPSYPSGHTIQALSTAIILSSMYPDYEQKFMLLAKKISYTRMLMGLHYKSDIEFGELIIEALTKHEAFVNEINNFIELTNVVVGQELKE